MRQISAQEKVIIPIGRQGENGAAEIIFDVSGWADLYGNGAFELLNRRPAENTPYTCSITVSDEQVHWIVQSADVALVGHGRCELTYVVDDVIAKSVVFATCVLPSIEGAGEVPEPYESRIQDLIVASAEAAMAAQDSEAYAVGKRDGADVQSDDPAYHNNSKYYSSRANSSANTAQGYASDAGTSAAMSSGSALKSEGFAVGTANGRAVADTSPYYHNNSKYYSEQASGSATAAAGSATAADESASAAAGSATAADESATAAAGSETAAAGSATAAAGSASAAAGSATAAAGSASDAAAQLALVTEEGTRQVGLITAEGTTQKNAVIAKGQEVIESIPEDYSDLTSDVEDLKSSLNVQAETFFKYNSCNILQFNTPFYRPQIYTVGGITFSWNDDYNECTINGATGGSSSNYNIYVNRTAMPFGMKAGEEYYIITDAPAYIRVIVNMYVSDVATEILRTSRSNTLKIPDEADGLLIQVRVLNNSTVNDFKLHLEILNAETNKKLEGKWNYSNISVFPNIGVIGDSWASGSLHTQSDYVMSNAEISWGQILARSSGINVVNFSQGGLTTKTWLSNTNNGLPKLLNTDKQQLYIINLGINDSSRIADGTYTLGSINDLHIDYTENPDTFYGNYGKIIGNIMEYATDAKIVCMSVCRPAQRNMDKDIEAIASYYGIPYVNVTKDHFFDSPYFINNIYDGHPTASGYAGMASAIERLIETCLVENTEYFSTYYGLPITT